MRARTVITGAHGLLGSVFACLLGEDAVALGRSELDITDEKWALSLLAEIRPGLILNCAASTDVDRCERDGDYAVSGNVSGPAVMARVASQLRAKLVHFSTDYVFDGAKAGPYNEGDEPRPANRYGESKLQGEHHVLGECPSALIIRTSWVYGRTHRSGPQPFPLKVLRWASEALDKTGKAGGQPAIRVAMDERGSPTYSEDLAPAVLELVQAETTGVVHLGGSGCASRFEVAEAVIADAGLFVRVLPASAADFSLPAVRPAQSCLDCTHAADRGVELPPWREAIARFIRGVAA